MTSQQAAQWFGALDICAAILMLWTLLKITTAAGLWTPMARWALFRRGIYCLLSIALFGLGWDRLSGDYPASWGELCWQGVLVFGIMIFPLLRVMGCITQDTFANGGTGGLRDRHRHYGLRN
jgi:hypothetical protein